MNPTKFGSLNLDIPSSRYEFLKISTKSMNINKEKFKNPKYTTCTRSSAPTATDNGDPRVNWPYLTAR